MKDALNYVQKGRPDEVSDHGRRNLHMGSFNIYRTGVGSANWQLHKSETYGCSQFGSRLQVVEQMNRLHILVVEKPRELHFLLSELRAISGTTNWFEPRVAAHLNLMSPPHATNARACYVEAPANRRKRGCNLPHVFDLGSSISGCALFAPGTGSVDAIWFTLTHATARPVSLP
ncbi:hypothetical protein BC826DRAFT_230899 [Russula brevipes]|nr:hypothetical protein BC826DRAFT_230899 [Russula brevipes]